MTANSASSLTVIPVVSLPHPKSTGLSFKCSSNGLLANPFFPGFCPPISPHASLPQNSLQVCDPWSNVSCPFHTTSTSALQPWEDQQGWCLSRPLCPWSPWHHEAWTWSFGGRRPKVSSYHQRSSFQYVLQCLKCESLAVKPGIAFTFLHSGAHTECHRAKASSG